MAWLTQVQRASGVAHKVRWRQPDDRQRMLSRSFQDLAEAEAFRDLVSELYPDRKPNPWSGARQSTRFPIKERILRAIRIDENGCWRWQRRVGKDGYGFIAIQVDGKPTTQLAHRVAYGELAGPIPEGLVIDHLCRVRDCVNPQHLEPVTSAENTRRSPIHPSKTRRKVAA